MKSLLKKIVFVLLLLPILIVLASFFLPSRYHVERSAIIQAPPESVFPLLNQLRRWPEWTAWNTNREATLVYAYSGSNEGTGSIQSWTAQSGNGVIKLTSSDPNEGVRYELNFNEGRFISRGAILMTPTDKGTRLIWTNDGDLGKNPVARYLGLMMDKWMGADFETGLANLKTKLEAAEK